MKPDIDPNDIVPYERKGVGKSRIRSIIAMTHLFAVIIFSFIAWVSAAIAIRQFPSLKVSMFLIVAMACIQISIGISNEVFDRQIDAIAKPWRAIPAGHISVRWSVMLALLASTIGFYIATLISRGSAVVLVICLGAGMAHNAGLKRTPLSWLPYLIGYPLVPVWAWVSVGKFEAGQLMIFVFAAPFAIATHLCNQLRDFEDDAMLGIGGVVHYLGKSRATNLCYLLLAISPIPVIAFTLLSAQPEIIIWLLLVGVIHWYITMNIYFSSRPGFSPASFRYLFKKLQICGLLLSFAWIWILTTPIR